MWRKFQNKVEPDRWNSFHDEAPLEWLWSLNFISAARRQKLPAEVGFAGFSSTRYNDELEIPFMTPPSQESKSSFANSAQRIAEVDIRWCNPKRPKHRSEKQNKHCMKKEIYKAALQGSLYSISPILKKTWASFRSCSSTTLAARLLSPLSGTGHLSSSRLFGCFSCSFSTLRPLRTTLFQYYHHLTSRPTDCGINKYFLRLHGLRNRGLAIRRLSTYWKVGPALFP